MTTKKERDWSWLLIVALVVIPLVMFGLLSWMDTPEYRAQRYVEHVLEEQERTKAICEACRKAGIEMPKECVR